MTTPQTQRGSIFFYIMLAVVLFAALSYAVSRMTSGGGEAGSKEIAKLGAQAILEYAQKAKITVQDMKLQGSAMSAITYLKPGDMGYTTPPHTNKLFHPEGGGLPQPNLTRFMEPPVSGAGVFGRLVSVPNIGGADPDIVLSFMGVKKAVCEELNRQFTGSATIPSTGSNSHLLMFVLGGTPVDGTTCPGCVAKPALCLAETPLTLYTFYTVLDAN